MLNSFSLSLLFLIVRLLGHVKMTTLISIALAVISLLLPLAAHATKTLNLAVNAAESTFDPAAIDDIPSSDIAVMMMEPPLQYDYFARPVALAARTSDLIESSPDGKAYTLRVKPGIFFTPDAAFSGKQRPFRQKKTPKTHFFKYSC